MRSRPDPIHAHAPLRISFVGGGTDFPHYYLEHGGAVLSATIDRSVRVQISPRRERRVAVRSRDLGRMVEYPLDQDPNYDGVMDLAKAAIERVGVPCGIDVAIRSDAPPGSGLGGSSALVTAMVAGLAMLGDRSYTRQELAKLSYSIEREDLGISGGWQDQYAASYGGLNLIEFSNDGTSVLPLRAGDPTVRLLQRNLLLCFSGTVRKDVGLIDRQIELYREGREETILGMKHLQETAYLMRDALEAGDPDALGALLRKAFESKKQMNPHITEHTGIEAMLERAHRAGAMGGKICGAGGGGYLLVYATSRSRARVAAALEELGGQIAPFAFTRDGVRARRGSEVWSPSP
jgi:D-glycero-alpha-D-manno-heptose-7-phosphate kinase